MALLPHVHLKLIDDGRIEALHTAGLDILTRVGIRLEDDDLTARVQDHGGTRRDGRVQFPADLVESAIGNQKSEIRLRSRTGREVHIRDGHVFTHPGGSIPFVYDLATGAKRNATLQDLVDMIRLMNRLEHLDLPGALVLPAELPPPVAEIHQCAVLLRHAVKPVSGSGPLNEAQARHIVRLYQALAGSADNLRRFPPGDIGMSPESPLYYPADMVAVMKTAIGAGIPTVPLIAPVLGFTGPLTFAGGMAQMNASLLAFVTLAYLIDPATPIVYGGRLCPANLRTGNSISGLPAVGQAGAWTVQLARRYGMPSDVYGLSSSTCAFDNQMGYEKAANALLPLLAGANVISGFGTFTSGLLAAYEQLVIDDETFGMLLRCTRPAPVTPETLAVEAVERAMAGEPFVQQDHTFAHLRDEEIYHPGLSFSGLWSEWTEDGARDIRRRARERALALLAEADPEPLPAETEREFNAILTAADNELL